ncbi:MAG: hypothetical protein EOP61_04275 [Sphingomonadales bacterium]|nr:MAG: hypothetical protein EOP61_04275 [Sphingomonadales bacterium]
MIDHYDWEGGREAMLRFGPDTGPVVIAALPLFEEANRTRTFLVTVLRALAERGISGVLPDLPGQGESLVSTSQASLAAMRDAFAAIPGDYSVAVRSGALLDAGNRKGRWHFAPQQGAEMLRELNRLRQAAGSEDFGGNRISPALIAELETATTAEARIVRHETDAKAADLKVFGAPLWRRAEPDNDPALAALLADDIADWIRTCEG